MSQALESYLLQIFASSRNAESQFVSFGNFECRFERSSTQFGDHFFDFVHFCFRQSLSEWNSTSRRVSIKRYHCLTLTFISFIRFFVCIWIDMSDPRPADRSFVMSALFWKESDQIRSLSETLSLNSRFRVTAVHRRPGTMIRLLRPTHTHDPKRLAFWIRICMWSEVKSGVKKTMSQDPTDDRLQSVQTKRRRSQETNGGNQLICFYWNMFDSHPLF